jgi:hypothetical protein
MGQQASADPGVVLRLNRSIKQRGHAQGDVVVARVVARSVRFGTSILPPQQGINMFRNWRMG